VRAAIFALALAACVPTEVKQGAAKATYQSDQDRCVDDYDTKAEIDACRAYERARWGKAPVSWPLADAGPSDAGGDR